MSIKSVTPEETQQLLESGYVFIDVRSPPEFAEGHVPGALNAPIREPDFLPVMQQAFAKNDKLVIGCRSGSRSRRAAEMLEQAGFSELAEMSAGWEGSRDHFGRPTPGWRPKGLPVEPGAPAGQSYADVKQRTAR